MGILKYFYLLALRVSYLIISIFVREDKKSILIYETFEQTSFFSNKIPDYFFTKRTVNKRTPMIKKLILLKKSRYIYLDNYNIEITKIGKKKQIYMLWHANGAIKNFALLDKNVKGKASKRDVKRYGKFYNRVNNYYVGSKEYAKILEGAFNIKSEKIKVTGYYLTDIYYNNNLELETKRLKEEFNFLSEDKQIICYLPTFRRGGSNKQYKIIKKLVDELGEIYHICYKTHPETKIKDVNGAINLTNESVTDLFYISDIMITDYSSVAFEYAFFNKPIIFHQYDLEEYREKHGFAIDMEELPGKITTTEEQLISALEGKVKISPKMKQWHEKYNCENKGYAIRNILEDNLLKENDVSIGVK